MADGLSFYCLECNRRRSNTWYRQSRVALGKTVRDHSWVPEGFRWCPTCREAVPEADYVVSRRTSSGFGSQCKPWHRQACKDTYWRRKYGLTLTAVAELRRDQEDRCAICRDPAPEHLDHDHDSGEVRALLCQRCNFGLGLYRDDPTLLRAAADYVEEHRERHRRSRPQPLVRRRPEVISRPVSPPVGSAQRPPSFRRTGLCSRGRALLAARGAGE
ncbi:endonuclease domain-containing protein [Modestobacter marinus]|uniref:endonuclease domain-containing protein n=1 Tax=Modestobacter marinus TaxID=477641 RepID=UPI0034D50EF6